MRDEDERTEVLGGRGGATPVEGEPDPFRRKQVGIRIKGRRTAKFDARTKVRFRWTDLDGEVQEEELRATVVVADLLALKQAGMKDIEVWYEERWVPWDPVREDE